MIAADLQRNINWQWSSFKALILNFFPLVADFCFEIISGLKYKQKFHVTGKTFYLQKKIVAENIYPDLWIYCSWCLQLYLKYFLGPFLWLRATLSMTGLNPDFCPCDINFANYTKPEFHCPTQPFKQPDERHKLNEPFYLLSYSRMKFWEFTCNNYTFLFSCYFMEFNSNEKQKNRSEDRIPIVC